MARWFRFYDEALNDPKVQRLSGDLYKAWVNLLCVASISGGVIRSRSDAAFALRLPETKAGAIVAELASHGLLDPVSDGYFAPHNWTSRQFKSDVSTDRVKQFRQQRPKRKRNVSSNAPETPDETPPEQIQNRTEAETERKKEDVGESSPPVSSEVPSIYAFESGVIHLTQADFDKWKQAFSNLDLAAELLALTQWAGEQEKWFFAVSGALAKRNRQALIEIKRQNANGTDPHDWRNAIL